jgi:hypothetical protein
MSIENGNHPSDLSADLSAGKEDRQEKKLSPAPQPNPLRWHGEEFEVIVKEETRMGEKHLVFGMMDSNKEVVVIDFTQAGKFSTTFLNSEEMELFDADTPQEGTPAPGSPPLPHHSLGVGGDSNQVSPTPDSETDQARPEKQAPTKISGNIRELGQLGKTKKQETPMLFFSVWDSENNMERRMIAFGIVAEQLASPDTDLQPEEDITLYAHKHINKVHVRGKEKEVEDWYVQAAVYHEKRYEKPRNKRKKE